MFHITCLHWQKTIFDKCQKKNLVLADHNKIYAFIYNGKVSQNLIYIIIERVIKLKDFFDKYCYKISKSRNKNDQNTIPDKL